MIFNVGGGGGSSTKSTIIVSIDTGSTVQAYSDASYQTLVKTASEKSTGEYWLTGLANGTYYLKATKNGETATTSYTISQYGVYRISMSYFQATIVANFPTSCSSVTLTNGADSYSVPSGDIANGTYTFTVTSTGTYTLNAVVGGYTLDGTSSGVGKTATITTFGQSETITVNVLWLFRDPEEFTDVTGGWGTVNSYYYCTVNTIDFTAFSSITWIDRSMTYPSYSQNGYCLAASRGTYNSGIGMKTSSISQSSPATIDLSSVSGTYYVNLQRDVNSPVSSWGKVYASAT